MRIARLFLILLGIAAVSSVSKASHLGDNGILLGDDNSVLHMCQAKAINSCPYGTHLPSVGELLRECAQYSIDPIRAIIDPKEIAPSKVPNGYLLLISLTPRVATGDLNINVSVNEYYFNGQYCAPSQGEAGRPSYWSSSLTPSGYGYTNIMPENTTTSGAAIAYAPGIMQSDCGTYGQSGQLAVRCIANGP